MEPPACGATLSELLDAATLARPLDSIEIRGRSIHYFTDGDTVLGKRGTLCAGATDERECWVALGRLMSKTREGWFDPRDRNRGYRLQAVYTRGDEVGIATNPDDFVKLFAPIESFAEAQLTVWARHGYQVKCDTRPAPSQRTTADGFYEIELVEAVCSVEHHVIEVGRDGATRVVRSETLVADRCDAGGP